MKKIKALKARQNFGGLLEAVYHRGHRFIIERAGRPMAAMIPLWELQEWQDRREGFFGQMEEVWEKNKKVPSAILEQEVSEAVGSRSKRSPAKKK